MKIRSATKKDKIDIAHMMVTASGGLCDYLLSDLITKISIDQLLAFEIAKDHSSFSYKNCLVAEHEGQVSGVLCCYPYNQMNLASLNHLSPEKKALLKPCYESRGDRTLYIDTLCVLPSMQGRGVATALLAQVELLIDLNQFDELVLYVWSSNQTARRLYHRFSFEVIKQIPLVVPEFITQQPRLLMGCSREKFLASCEINLENVPSLISSLTDVVRHELVTES